jgi:type I restriction enzyme M protein
VRQWWIDRKDIQDEDGNFKAKQFSKEEIIAGSYNLDLCSYPHKVEEILEPMELIENYKVKRAELNAQIDAVLKEITALLENPEL